MATSTDSPDGCGAECDGRAFTDYPRPSVAVDIAVLTVRDEALHVVVVEHRTGGLALPCTFLHAGERLSDAAARALGEKAGLRDVTFEQLRVFDDPDRDERGWVLSVGHTSAMAVARLPADVGLIPVSSVMEDQSLRFDHADIVALAVDNLRLQYGKRLDPAQLLGETFTVLEVRRIYQAVFGRPLIKDTFRRYVIDAIEATGEMATAFGRPAELFRRREDAALPTTASAFFTSGGRHYGRLLQAGDLDPSATNCFTGFR